VLYTCEYITGAVLSVWKHKKYNKTSVVQWLVFHEVSPVLAGTLRPPQHYHDCQSSAPHHLHFIERSSSAVLVTSLGVSRYLRCFGVIVRSLQRLMRLSCCSGCAVPRVDWSFWLVSDWSVVAMTTMTTMIPTIWFSCRFVIAASFFSQIVLLLRTWNTNSVAMHIRNVCINWTF
jgi:hypothetical protein